MSNSKRRVRVARIAAAAVFAAGASLTAAGTAQALDIGVGAGEDGLNADAKTKNGAIAGLVAGSEGGDNEGAIVGVIEGNESEGSQGGENEGPGGDDNQGGENEGPGGDDNQGGENEGPGGDDNQGGENEGPGGDDNQGGENEGPGGDDNQGGVNEGVVEGAVEGTDGGSEDGGPETTGGQTTGGGGDEGDTCVIDGTTVPCDDAGTVPDGQTTGGGEQEPVTDEQPKEELAETGSGQTTFLVIGAATMIAGGVGFRLLPRLINNRGAAAA